MRAGKVLVVGGAGYVGCVLVEALLERGYSVRVLDRMFFGRAPVEAFQDRVELVVADMREISEQHLHDCAAVINVGGLSNDPTAEFDPQANEELNHRAAVRVAQVAKAAGVPKLIFASTASIYDRGVDDEAGDLVLDEDARVAPRAAYATTKRAAEVEILALTDAGFAPVVFRKGTVFGFSPRMRYDLVVNSFVKDAMSSGTIHVFYGGRMWRPLVDVEDVARAYIRALDAESEVVGGQIFNLAAANFRIAELALEVRRALSEAGVPSELDVDYENRLIRSYRVSSEKAERLLGFSARVSVAESVTRMVREIRARSLTDFSHPRYHNIEWMKVLEEATGIVREHGYVLSRPEPDVDLREGVTRFPGRDRRSG
ncbi:MAG TPA: SDR family oxidoreductase [Actinomycetota bacterium]|nr:SDR family oxidoreductase [Actinomycetota bacterium]